MAQNLSVFDNRAFSGKLEIASGVSHACLLAMSLLKKSTWCTALEFQVSVLTSIWLFVVFLGCINFPFSIKRLVAGLCGDPGRVALLAVSPPGPAIAIRRVFIPFQPIWGICLSLRTPINLQSFEVPQVGWKASGQKSLAHINQPP